MHLTHEPFVAQTNSGQNTDFPLSGRTSITTPALPETWAKMLEWAHDQSVIDDIVHVANCTGLTRYPHLLGRVLAALDSTVAKTLLERWRRESEHAQTLHRLAIARSTPDPRLAAYRPITDLVPATTHITEDIGTYYLIALLAARLPAIEPEEHRTWFECLRLWLLVHCLERAALGNRQDKYLEVVCSKLRLAHDGNKGWIDIFRRLRTGSIGFESIGIHLASTAQQMLDSQSTDTVLTPTQRHLLESLVSVSRHEHSPKAGEFSFPAHVGERNILSGGQTWDAFSAPPSTTEEFDPEEPAPPALIPSADGSADLQKISVCEKESYAHQQLRANSILLSAAEDLHFLPWSWNRPNPGEFPLIARWIQKGLQAQEVAERAITTFSLVALMTGRSLRRTLDITLGMEPAQEWTLDLKGKQLLRIPPRRMPGWSPDGAYACSWVSPMAQACSLPLPDLAADFLNSLDSGASKPKNLGDLWSSAWGTSPESAFLKSTKDALPRLSPAMLANALPQHAFLQTGDSVFSRLLSSHPRTGLPGSTAYASWRNNEVDGILASFVSTLGFPERLSKPESAPLNAMGSQLEVLEGVLADAIKKLDNRVEEIRHAGSLIDFHNALTAQLLIKLYAATGARPLRDPFCSPRHFGFEDEVVFIDDKHSRKARTGRLITLPKVLTGELRHSYLKHLSCMAEVLQAGAPGLSAAISTLSRGQESDRLPFFFLLETESGIVRWRHASEKHLRELDILECPLPLNLFRHRLATRLRRHGVDPELIDALLGHAESGASTHGDHSFRVWREDMSSLRAPLESCLEALGFTTTKLRPPPAEPFAVCEDADSHTRDFGAKARANARRERIRTAISNARGIITAHQKGRGLDELTKDELDTLVRALLTNETGLPHPLGALRYSVLISAANNLNAKEGKKVRFSHRYLQLEEETSPFSSNGPGATIVLECLASEVETLVPNLTKLRLGKMDAAAIASVLLIVQSRIADRRLIRDVMTGQNVRLIRARTGFYLEHGKNLTANDPSAPVHRHRISNATARLINIALDRSQQRSFDDRPIPAALRSIADNLIKNGRLRESAEVSHLFASLTDIVDQENIQTLPGVVAGYLGGRVESASLEWRDWTRLRWNQRIEVNSATQDLLQEAPDDDLPACMPETCDIEVLQKEARILFSKVGKQLDPDSQTLPLTQNARRDIKAAIRKTIAEADGTAPRACLLLCSWVASLLERKSGHDGFLARNAIKRYFSALSPAFAAVGYDIDLDLADEDEITEFYTEVIEGRELQNPDFVFGRLKEFHRWLSEQIEVEDPIWAELPCHDGSVPVDPGIVVESDYLRAFNVLARRTAKREHSRYAAFLLLGEYRFGLRGGEVLGLMHSDWIAIAGYQVAVVQNNRYRRLKRRSSRRAVPLLTSLTPAESALIDWIKATAEARAGDDRHVLLFPSSNKKMQHQLRRLALDALKSATGNPDSNLHRLRHSAANQVMLGLAGIELPSWGLVSKIGKIETPRAQGLLLGRTGPTRRASWASARYLGHASPRTAFQSYYHFISDLAEQCIALPTESPRQYEHAIDLTCYPRLTIEKPASEVANPLLMYGHAETVIKSLRLLARGKREEEIADWMGWEPAKLKSLTAAVDAIDSRMNRQDNAADKEASQKCNWLTKITNHGWNRMLSTAGRVDEKLSSLALPPILLSCIVRMVGSSRQLLAWKEEHFQALSLLQDYWNIDESQYAFLMTGQNAYIKKISSTYGFLPVDHKTHGHRANGHQIDTGFEDDERNLRVAARCAFCLTESDRTTIRNRFELIVAFLSISGA